MSSIKVNGWTVPAKDASLKVVYAPTSSRGLSIDGTQKKESSQIKRRWSLAISHIKKEDADTISNLFSGLNDGWDFDGAIYSDGGIMPELGSTYNTAGLGITTPFGTGYLVTTSTTFDVGFKDQWSINFARYRSGNVGDDSSWDHYCVTDRDWHFVNGIRVDGVAPYINKVGTGFNVAGSVLANMQIHYFTLCDNYITSNHAARLFSDYYQPGTGVIVSGGKLNGKVECSSGVVNITHDGMGPNGDLVSLSVEFSEI